MLEYELRSRLDDLVNLILESLPITEKRTYLLGKLNDALYVMLHECRHSTRTTAQKRIKDTQMQIRKKYRKRLRKVTRDLETGVISGDF